MSNISGDGGSFSTGNNDHNSGLLEELDIVQDDQQEQVLAVNYYSTTTSDGSTSQHLQSITPSLKKKRSLPGTPDPSAEVIALSPTSLMAKNKFVCEICNKGFQRDQNLQLHRRGHNLPWKLKQRTSIEVRKRVYVCPEPTCVHHNPARALGDLTGIKKHFSRKHGEKKWKCDKCSKKYAVQCDWKAHSKTCGSKEYKCDCGTIFSRRDSFITHRAFCDALTEENNKVNQNIQDHASDDVMPGMPPNNHPSTSISPPKFSQQDTKNPSILLSKPLNSVSGNLFSNPRNVSSGLQLGGNGGSFHGYNNQSNHQLGGSALTSATALLQKAAQLGATSSSNCATNSNSITNMAAPLFSSLQQQHMETLFTNQFMQNGLHQENSISRFFNTGSSHEDNANDMEMYAGFLSRDNEFMKSSGHDSNAVLEMQTIDEDSKVLMRFAGKGNSDDTMTVDFLGVGGMRPRNFNQHHHQGMEI